MYSLLATTLSRIANRTAQNYVKPLKNYVKFFLVQTTRLHESFSNVTISSRSIARSSFSLAKCRHWETHAFSAVFGILSTTGFFGHNFCSRHVGGSIKGSIDADDHLVSNTILSHKTGSLD